MKRIYGLYMRVYINKPAPDNVKGGLLIDYCASRKGGLTLVDNYANRPEISI